MKNIVRILCLFFTFGVFAQKNIEKEALENAKQAQNLIAEANTLFTSENNFVSAEMEYRKALSKTPNNVAGAYNLGYAYYKKGNFNEALYRNQQAVKQATDKLDKYRAFHNLGNILMQNKKCQEAVEAYKNALRNNPQDEETRYNLGLAKICAKQQKQNNKDQDDKSKDKENKDKNDDKNKGDNKDDNQKDKNNKDKKDEGDQDKKEGEDEKNDKGDPKDKKKDEKKEGEKGDKDKKQPSKPRQGQMSPQQIKNLLDDMTNQEQKVQEKMNAKKLKGVKVKTDKDW